MFRTLIVEDNAIFRQSLERSLRTQFPYMAVDDAADGKKVLKKVDIFRPDLIFTDIKLPEENGLDLTKKIKTHYSKIIIIILTNYDLSEYRQAAY